MRWPTDQDQDQDQESHVILTDQTTLIFCSGSGGDPEVFLLSVPITAAFASMSIAVVVSESKVPLRISASLLWTELLTGE